MLNPTHLHYVYRYFDDEDERRAAVGKVRARKTMRLGPVRLHFTERGFSSWSVKVGPWSFNSRARRHRVDLPGAWHWTSDRRP